MTKLEELFYKHMVESPVEDSENGNYVLYKKQAMAFGEEYGEYCAKEGFQEGRNLIINQFDLLEKTTPIHDTIYYVDWWDKFIENEKKNNR